MARTLGDLLLTIHFAFIVFAVLGGFLVLWKPWIVWLHLPSVLWSGYVNLFGQVCPLTLLENRFRYLAGQAGYEGGFIQHYLTPLVYPGMLPERWGLISGSLVLIWNVLIYSLVVTLRRHSSLRVARIAYSDAQRVRESKPRPTTGRSEGLRARGVAAEDVREMTGTGNTEQLAWMVLQTANRTQARGSKVRLVVPRASEMTYGQEPPLTEAELLEVEEYLLECGYVASTNVGLRWGTYTITPAGFSWLEGGLPERADRLRELAQRPGEEVAFKPTMRSELEEERRRMEELEEVRQEPPGASQHAAADAEKSGLHPARGNFQMASERLPWWRRMFGG